MHGDHHGLWIDPDEPVDALQRQRRRLLHVRRRRQDAGRSPWRPAASQFYNVALDTSTPAWAYGSIQDIGSRRGRVDLTQGPRPHPGGRVVRARQAAKDRITPSIRSNPNIVYSHGFYGNFTREDLGGRAARRLRRAQPGRSVAAARRAGVTAIRPAARTRTARAARAVDGADHRLAARSGDDLCRLSVRVPIDQSRRRVGDDQPGSDARTIPSQMLLEELERDSLPDDRRARRVAEGQGPALRRHRRRPAARHARRRRRPGRS